MSENIGQLQAVESAIVPVAVESAEPSWQRVRDVLAWFTAPKIAQAGVLDPLIRTLRTHNPKADVALIDRAFRTADHYHEGQKRKNGDAYITHPLAVATILAELGMTEPTIAAALLHDTVEDTSYTLQQLTADFGDEIALMVNGVTKLDKLTYGETAKAETIRKMVLAMSRDIRVVVIKLADRLHNMRTIGYLRPDKQARIARDTLEIFAPLAHRLGMNTIKWELEDLAFATLKPKVYDEIVRLVAGSAPQREEFLSQVTDQVKRDLEEAGIKAIVYGRPKHYYSIYQKMVVRNRDFFEIFDLVGLRIIVDSKADCYGALGVLHARWNPLPGRFKDYIAMPKYNLYQSLHTTVLGPAGKPVEFQIRTKEMHQRAEYGVAAHWKYKQGKAGGNQLAWVHQIEQWQEETEDSGEFLDTLRLEISTNSVFVFTPKGDVRSLPQGATPIDFAYSVHTEVGHRCIGARVNQRLVPLDSVLANGDIVEIITSKAQNAGPSRDWLNFVKTPRARNKIRHYFTRERREEAIDDGRQQLAKQVRRAGLPVQQYLSVENLTAIADHFRVADATALYAAIGDGTVSPQAVVRQLVTNAGGAEAAAETALTRSPLAATRSRAVLSDSGVDVDGDPDMWVKLAKCCTPVPGDEIIGFVTRGSGVSVHRKDCSNSTSLQNTPERIVPVHWGDRSVRSGTYLAAIQIEGLDRAGLLADVTRTLTDQRVIITAVSMKASKERIFKARLTFETPDPRHLQRVMSALQNVPGVYDVYRVNQ